MTHSVLHSFFLPLRTKLIHFCKQYTEQYLRQYKCRNSVCDDPSFDLAVLIVDIPFPINDYIRPVCLPPVGWARNLKGGKMIISGMGRTQTSGRQVSPTMQIATITMKSKMACTNSIGSHFKSVYTLYLIELFYKIYILFILFR